MQARFCVLWCVLRLLVWARRQGQFAPLTCWAFALSETALRKQLAGQELPVHASSLGHSLFPPSFLQSSPPFCHPLRLGCSYQYHPPFTWGWQRLNEVLFEVQEAAAAARR